METNETARSLLERLPNDCTIEDVLYRLYALQEVERGRADIAAGRVIPHAQVADELWGKWRRLLAPAPGRRSLAPARGIEKGLERSTTWVTD